MHLRFPRLRTVRAGALLVASLLTASLAQAQAQFAGTYIGTLNTRVSVPTQPVIESSIGAYSVTIAADGSVNLSLGALTGTINANGAITFTGGTQLAALGIRSATVANNQISSNYGDVVGNGTTQFRLNPSTGFTAAPGGGTGGGGTGGGGTGGGGTTNASFTNGSFEGGPNPGAGWTTLATGATSVNGWVVTAGSVDYMGTAWQASDGSRSWDLSGVTAGAIAQTFATTVGQTYTVTFDYAGNPGYGAGTGTKDMRVSVNNSAGTSQNYSFDTTGKTLANMGWVNRTFTFTASATSTTLTFTSLTNGVYGPALDNVKVNGSGGSVGTSGTTGAPAIVAATAPTTLVGYRNKVGQTFEFTITGSASGSIWGTDVYTDDSSVAAAAVHAGVLRAGETRNVTVTILAGQSSYAASTRNGITSGSWGAWSGSYSFAGAGAVTGGTAATVRPAIAPGFVAGAFNVTLGSRLVIPINVSGVGPFTYQWYLNGNAISGATANPYVIDTLSASSAGTYTVDVTNSAGTVRLTAGAVTVNASGAPSITLQPLSKTVAPGTAFTLLVSAQGASNTYQWFRNGVALTGETGNAILRQNVNANDAGNYTVRITNAAGTTTSNAATITIAADAARPANISCRTRVNPGPPLTIGFVVQGSGTKRVLVRAVGPGLAAFGLTGTLVDPKLEVYQQSNSRLINSNDDWAPSLAATFAAAGAFGLPAGSRDAAIVVDLPANGATAYTVQISGANNGTGLALVEVYDIDTAPTSKLVNVSVRGDVGTGADVLILGFVLQGRGQRTLLMRGIGPKLAAFGVTGTLVDPRLEIFDSAQRRLLINDDWNQADYQSEMVLAANFVNAFGLDEGSKDSSTLALLDPGAYTVQVSGANSGTGQALVEVYEVP